MLLIELLDKFGVVPTLDPFEGGLTLAGPTRGSAEELKKFWPKASLRYTPSNLFNDRPFNPTVYVDYEGQCAYWELANNAGWVNVEDLD